MNKFFNDPFTSFKEIFILYAFQIILIYDNNATRQTIHEKRLVIFLFFVLRITWNLVKIKLTFQFTLLLLNFRLSKLTSSSFLQSYNLDVVIIDVNECKNCTLWCLILTYYNLQYLLHSWNKENLVLISLFFFCPNEL